MPFPSTRPAPGVGERMATYADLHLSAPEQSPAAPASPTDATPPLGFALAQLKGAYILAENRAGLVLVDLHAAHERVLYERMKSAWRTGALASQPLLVPMTLAVNEAEADAAEHHAAAFDTIGFSLDRSGPTTILVRAVRRWCAGWKQRPWCGMCSPISAAWTAATASTVASMKSWATWPAAPPSTPTDRWPWRK